MTKESLLEDDPGRREMSSSQYPFVIRVTTLADFRQEAWPARVGPVRLELTSRDYPGPQLRGRRIYLSLTARTPGQEIVWLTYSEQISLVLSKPAFDLDRQITAGMDTAFQITWAYLAGQGYEVREGAWVIPEGYKPIRGIFECWRWVVEPDYVQVVACTEAEMNDAYNKRKSDPEE